MIPPKEAAVIRLGQRLRATLNSEGWLDVVKISQAIVDQALKEVKAYPGTDDAHMAKLTFIWKTLDAHHEKLLNSIQAAIEAGDGTAMQFRSSSQTQNRVAEPPIPSATAVIPACDVEREENAGTENE